MDILSHGLWGSIIFGRRNKRSFRLSFIYGIAPDFLSFGILFIQRLISSAVTGKWQIGTGKPDLLSIPDYVNTLYNITHSFIIFIAVFILVALYFKRPIWEMLAWPFHIFLDLFTHSTEFFPTPYLWPFPFVRVDGIPWSTPIIFFTNVFFLILIYSVYVYKNKNISKFKRRESR